MFMLIFYLEFIPNYKKIFTSNTNKNIPYKLLFSIYNSISFLFTYSNLDK